MHDAAAPAVQHAVQHTRQTMDLVRSGAQQLRDQAHAAAISVETLKGMVTLSGCAKNSTEKTPAEKIATQVKGVKSVHNAIIVRR